MSTTPHFFHMGELGDILYSWFFVKSTSPVDFSIFPRSIYGFDQYAALSRLASKQPYLKSFNKSEEITSAMSHLRVALCPHEEPEPPVIITAYFKAAGVPFPKYAPWVESVPGSFDGDYSVINVTKRYRDPNFHWGTALPAGEMRFLGLPEEFEAFITHLCATGYNDAAERVRYTETTDLFDAAVQIAGARAFFGNASSCLALAQGIGHPRIYVELTDITVMTCMFDFERVLNVPPNQNR